MIAKSDFKLLGSNALNPFPPAGPFHPARYVLDPRQVNLDRIVTETANPFEVASRFPASRDHGQMKGPVRRRRDRHKAEQTA